jgi:membrane associated rhomboid family serine protease
VTGAFSKARRSSRGSKRGERKLSPIFLSDNPAQMSPDITPLASAVPAGEESAQRGGPLSVTEPRQPIFNVPAIVVAVLAALFAVHLVRLFVLPPKQELEFLLLFAFLPVRYDPSLLIGGAMPGGLPADIWTFVTYALIHADFMHLGFNSIWLLAFGTPVARRFGAWRFLAFLAVTAAAGAAAHLATHGGQTLPMVGASASISGAMAASMRFAFQRGGPVWTRGSDPAVYRMPALPLTETLRDRRILIFLVVWFGLNFLFGLGSLSLTGSDQSVAWQAHIGGFLAGLLLFGLFDPVSRQADGEPSQSAEM